MGFENLLRKIWKHIRIYMWKEKLFAGVSGFRLDFDKRRKDGYSGYPFET